MNNTRIRAKIDVSKIDKSLLYKGKKGTYLNITFIKNRDGEGQYGDTHFIVQDVSKEQRDAGEKGPIIGNGTVSTLEKSGGGRPQQRSQKPSKPADDWDENDDDDIPF